ncbi:hypothetical protein [Curtobacterium sp. MCSS17_007]|uniref:hypothetical protein n=1 Tax=Curtobacterium sp. MCSS17_007 TaxID=2175646 RepID=UPI000DA74AD7|nr:hypothetical protein [Curtobacterium sp. MCSS17_007]WIE76256.1 hypothetical protein DEJ22_003040 [Curtobacterium sp. MCSS17_007]
MREELEAVLHAHRVTPLPEGIDRASVCDPDLPSAEIVGWATLVAAGVPLSPSEQDRLADTAANAFALIALLPVAARPYFARLGLIATLASALAVGAPASR